MTCIIVSSEHDMEEAIKYTVNLTKKIRGKKKLGFSFPSDGMSHIFLNNLALTFIREGISMRQNLELDIFLPPDSGGIEIDDGDELDMLDDNEYWDFDSLYDDDE